MHPEAITLTVSLPTGHKTALRRCVQAQGYGPLATFRTDDHSPRTAIAHRASGLPLYLLPDAVAARSAVEFLLSQVSDWGKAVVGLRGHSDELALALARLGS